MTDEVDVYVEPVNTPETPLFDFNVVYPHPLDENQNVIWSAARLAEFKEANRPILAQIARLDRDNLLIEYDKLVGKTVRDIRLAGPSGDVTKLYAFIDRLDAWAIALQKLPEAWGFPENIRWPEQPTLEQE